MFVDFCFRIFFFSFLFFVTYFLFSINCVALVVYLEVGCAASVSS